MRKKIGRPRKAAAAKKLETIQIRLNSAEKEAFQSAAEMDGKKTSEWIRDRLRRVSREELERVGRPVSFLITS
jgi:uncharacterized protein (DUF1778 family)